MTVAAAMSRLTSGSAAPMSDPINLRHRYYVAGHGKDRTARVLAVAEGWAMARFKGAMPFVVSVSDLFPQGCGDE